jgi:hypothetical protein
MALVKRGCELAEMKLSMSVNLKRQGYISRSIVRKLRKSSLIIEEVLHKLAYNCYIVI